MPSNRYGSLYETFVVPDLYNKVWPVVPPAPLNLPSADFLPGFLQNRYNLGVPGTRSIGFSPRDIPTLRKLGVFCNFADGLIFNNTIWNVSNGLNVRIDLSTWGPKLSGTVSVAGNALTGVGTLFTRELALNMVISYESATGLIQTATVLAIASDVAATITPNPSPAAAGSSAWPELLTSFSNIQFPVYALNELFEQSYRIGDVSKIMEIYSGDITVAAGSANVTGRGTRFLSELQSAGIGNQFIRWVSDAGVMVTRQIAGIASDTALTLVSVSPSTATNKPLTPSFNHIRIKATIDDALVFDTISVEPAHSVSQLSFGLVAEIEHNLNIIVAV